MAGRRPGARAAPPSPARRLVLQVTATYVAVAGALLFAVGVLPAGLVLPGWAFPALAGALLTGLPLAGVLAWVRGLARGAGEPSGTVPRGTPWPDDFWAPPSSPPGADLPPEPRPRAAGRPDDVRSPPPPTAAPPTSVAVLPFEDRSRTRENEYFTDGMTDDVITCLGRIRELKVISRSSSIHFRDTGKDAGEIARELGVTHLVEGSVERSGDRVRVEARLLDARAAAPVWRNVYDRPLADIFDIQSELARQIARALDTAPTPAELIRIERVPTTDLAAWDLYLRGRHLWNRRTEGALLESLAWYEKALDADPRLAEAAAGIADSHITLGIYGERSPADTMHRARSALDRALADDGELPQALTARGCLRAVYNWEWGAAEWDFRRAIEIDPHYSTAHHWYAVHCLAPQGRLDEARRALERARDVDPLSPAVRASLGVLSYFEGRPGAALEAYEAILAVHADFPLAHYFKGQALVLQGRHDEAAESLGRALVLADRSAEVVAALAHARALAGAVRDARALLAELEKRARRSYVSPTLLAQVHTALGDRERALACLEEALRLRATDLIWIRVRPAFDPLRSEPRLVAILHAMGLPVAPPPGRGRS